MENNTVSRRDQALDDIAEMAGILGRAPRSVTLEELHKEFDTEVTGAEVADLVEAIRNGERCADCGYGPERGGPINIGICESCNYQNRS